MATTASVSISKVRPMSQKNIARGVLLGARKDGMPS